MHKLTRSFVVAGVVGIAILAACDGDAGNKAPSKIYDVDKLAYIVEFRLDDGTRCIANAPGGITCDWRK